MSDPTTTPPDDARPTSARRGLGWSRRLDRLGLLGTCEVLAVASLVLAMAIGMVAAVLAGWSPMSDDALIELLVRDVPGHLPLTGVYSRYGWSHPGPAMFYLLAVPYRLFGGASSGLVVGSLAGQMLAVIGAWWAVRRVDRVASMIVLCAGSAILVTTGAAVLRSPWNPHVALAGSLLLVVLAWSMSLRARTGLIALLPVGSLLVQSHVVTAPMVATTCAAALVLAVAPWGRSERPGWDRPRRRAAVLGAALTVLIWLPPVVQQFIGDPGNLGELLARRGTGEAFGVTSALAIMTQAFGPIPSVLDPAAVTAPFASSDWTVPIWLVVPLAGAVVAIRRRDTVNLRALAVAGAALIGCIAGIASISDAMYTYLLMWNRGVVVATIALGFVALAAGLPDGTRRRVLVGVAAVVVVLNVGIGVGQLATRNSLSGYSRTVDALEAAVDDAGLTGVVAVDPLPGVQPSEVAQGLMLRLERDGYEVTSQSLSAARIGAHRDDRVAQHLLLVAPIETAEQLEEDGWTVLTSYEPISSSDSARLDALREELAGLDDPATEAERDDFFNRKIDIAAEIDEIQDERVPMLVAVRPA